MGQSGQHAGGDQFYVTHCNVADSVLNNPGYTVRAASATEPVALDAAFHYPPYELPIDMWKDLPPVALAPRRLARTKHPSGGVWAVHSCYLAKDSVGRDRSYFSHLLALSSADPAAVLRSWGADGWSKSYPVGAAKSLPNDAELPVGTLVSDAALTAFLSDTPTGPTELSTTVCPVRLRASATVRRELFGRMLKAMLLLAKEENEARRRLYVHAEPGVVALLLYGAVRLLPESATRDLTFSTFEPYHRNIRDYKLSEVVGTFTGTPDKGLDTDLGTTRGIALDTVIASRSSPELRAAAIPEGVSALIDLAASGDWDLLSVVQHAVGNDPSGLANAESALTRARGLTRIDSGTIAIDELIAIQTDKFAVEELKARADKIWPIVKVACLSRDDVRTAFRDFIADPDRLRELWEEAVAALFSEDFRKWEPRWSAIRAVAGTDEARRLLDKLVGSEKNESKLTKLTTDVRQKMRLACADVNLLPPRPLLIPIGLGELEPLLQSQPAWAGYTAFVLMADDSYNWLAHVPVAAREQMRKRARDYLFAAPPAAIASYVRAARPFLESDSTFLDRLFTPYSEAAAKLMDKLLAAGTLEPDDWMNLCAMLRLTENEWGAFLLENNRLATLLYGLGGDGAGKAMWEAYLGLLTPALVAPDLAEVGDDGDPVVIHKWERQVHSHLRDAAARFSAANVRLVQALPEGGVKRLFAANSLVKWVANPASIPRDAPDEVPHACDTFAVNRRGFVRAAYKQAGFDRIALPEEAAKLGPMVELVRACFPIDESYESVHRAVTEVIMLSADCPQRTRGLFQAHIIFACVPELHFSDLIYVPRQYPLDPFAVARIKERLAKPAKKMGPKYVPPTAPSDAAQEAVPVDEPSADEPEEVIVSPRKKGRKKPYKSAKKSGCLGMIVVVFLLAMFVVVAVR